jgi:hypothetical protein
MTRYGEDILSHDDDRKRDLVELLEMDSIKRQLSIEKDVKLIKSALAKEIHKVKNATVGQMHLKVSVLKGEDLPSMDVRAGIDSYCVLSVDGLENEVYQTKIVMKMKDPEWNAHFEWVISPDVELLTIAVVDHDKLTQDDLVSDPSTCTCWTSQKYPVHLYCRDPCVVACDRHATGCGTAHVLWLVIDTRRDAVLHGCGRHCNIQEALVDVRSVTRARRPDSHTLLHCKADIHGSACVIEHAR